MSNSIIQPSFSAGELSSSLYARVDYAKYHVGLARCRNFFVDYRGGASTRSGTEFVCLAKQSQYGTNDPALPVRLIPFQFSTIQTYILEFGDFYMRVITNGAPVLETAIGISAITQLNPGTITTATPHGFSNGDTIFINDIVGMTELNQMTVIVQPTGASTFTMVDLYGGNSINTTTYNAYVSGGTVGRVFTAVSPYAANDLAMLKFAQTADIMTITHPGYPIYELRRLASDNWTFTTIAVGADIAAPTGLSATPTAGAGTAAYAYEVTAVSATGQESVASARADAINTTDISSSAGSIALTWNPVTGAQYYNVYAASPVTDGSIPVGVNFGFMADSTTTNSVDANILSDFTRGPPSHKDPFTGGNNPGTVGFFSQRRVFAASTANPETFWMSQPGSFSNFDVSNPVKASDAITGTLVSAQVNAIKYMIGMPGGLIMLTSGGAWQVSGGSPNAAVTPTTITATPQAYNGCSDVPPLAINYDILYVFNSTVRDLSYNFYTNIYTGVDISLLSNHLFIGYTIKEWAFAEEPFKVVWAVRSDGRLLSLTYLKEQEIQGWAQHDTFGLFKSVATVREDRENVIYTVVSRLIGNRSYLQYIERMHTREFPYGVEDAFSVDCGLTNTLTYPNSILYASGFTGNVAFAAVSPVFGPGDVGKVIRMGGGIGVVTSVSGSGTIFVTLTRNITNLIWNGTSYVVPFADAGTWSLTAEDTTFGNLQHLEGANVAILGDGNVFPNQIVRNGQITLDHPCSKVTIGLPFMPQLQTLYLDVGEPTIQGKRKRIAALTTRVADTRGLAFGSTFDTLTEYKQRDTQLMGQPIELQTGDQRIVMDPSWNIYGQVCIQQNYPLPATVLGVIPEIIIGDSK